MMKTLFYFLVQLTPFLSGVLVGAGLVYLRYAHRWLEIQEYWLQKYEAQERDLIGILWQAANDPIGDEDPFKEEREKQALLMRKTK